MPDARKTGPAFPSTPLLACPFCGCAGRWFRTGRDVGVECTGVDTVGCPGCAQTDVYAPEHADDAAHQWNRRPDSRESAIVIELIEALQHAVRWFDQLKPEDIARYQIAIAKAAGSAA